MRLCLDYRAVNAKSLPENYTIRTPEDCLAEVGQGGGRHFIALDLSSGFYQMELAPQSRHVTAFTVPGMGQLQWTRGAMGLKGCPGSFARLMDMALRDIPNAITYIDDVLIFGSSPEAALHTLDAVLHKLKQHHLKVNLKKSSFLAPTTEYLGHSLSAQGIQPGKDKTKAILEAQPPHTIKQLKSFLGMVNYFRNFIPHFARMATKLYALTRADSPWRQGPLPPEAAATFQKVKAAIARAVPRSFPFPDGKFHLYVDGASGDSKEEGGLGAHLMQEGPDGKKHSIGFHSRQLKKHEKNYSAFLLELQAAVEGIDFFYQYLRGRTFVLYTDHAPLTKLSTTHTKTLHRLHALLNEHSFEMRHIPGKLNPVADFLSRSHGAATANQLSAVNTEAEQLQRLQAQDPVIHPIGRALARGQPLPLPKNLERYRDRISLAGNVVVVTLPARPGRLNDERPRALVPHVLRASLIQEAHNSALAGHQGIFKTAERIRESFWWPGMETEVAEHVRNCTTCQATSNKDKPPPHPADQYPQTRAPNQRVHLDLFGPIKDKEGRPKYILGMTDAFTKILRLAAIENKHATTVAWAIWKEWMAIYGIPRVIVTDQGTEFCNNLQRQIWEVLQIKHNTTTPYWPVCNQMQERQNKELAHYIRTILHASQKSTLDWEYYLPALMLSINTAVNRATKQAPFFTMFGYDARLPMWSDMDILQQKDYQLPPDEKDLFFGWQDTRRAARKLAHDADNKFRDDLQQSQVPSSPPTAFRAGDPVWVERLVPQDTNKKFGAKWDPAIIMERTGTHTYKVRRLSGHRKKILVMNAAHLKPRTEEQEEEEEREDMGQSDDENNEEETEEESEEEEAEDEKSSSRRSTRAKKPAVRFTPSEKIDAVRVKIGGKWLSVPTAIATKKQWSWKEMEQLLEKMSKDPTPDCQIVFPYRLPPPGGPPPPPAPPPPPPPGGGGAAAPPSPPPPPPHIGPPQGLPSLPPCTVHGDMTGRAAPLHPRPLPPHGRRPHRPPLPPQAHLPQTRPASRPACHRGTLPPASQWSGWRPKWSSREGDNVALLPPPSPYQNFSPLHRLNRQDHQRHLPRQESSFPHSFPCPSIQPTCRDS